MHPEVRLNPLPWRCLQSGMTFFSPRPTHCTPTQPPQHTPLGVRSVAVALAWALTGAAAWAQTAPAEAPLGASPKVERIVHEDAGSRVQELKVGGQTKQIEVQTKADLPAYQINPTDAAQGPANPDGQRTGNAGSAGRTTWRLFNF